MNVFDRWLGDGLHLLTCGTRVQLQRLHVSYTCDSMAEAQEWLENHYDVPTPARLKAAGWVNAGVGHWRKVGTTVALQDTLAAMEALVDAVTHEGLLKLGWETLADRRYRWHNDAACPFHLKLEAGITRISVSDGHFIFAGTKKLSVVKGWMEKLK